MDWVKYYQDQINKSTNNRLNKVEDFTGNQQVFKGKGQEWGSFNPVWGVHKLSQQVSNQIADENKNKTIEKFIDNRNEKVKSEMIKVKDSVKNA